MLIPATSRLSIQQWLKPDQPDWAGVHVGELMCKLYPWCDGYFVQESAGWWQGWPGERWIGIHWMLHPTYSVLNFLFRWDHFLEHSHGTQILCYFAHPNKFTTYPFPWPLFYFETGSHCIALPGLKLIEMAASASQVLGSKVWATTPSSHDLFVTHLIF